jgi:hypothetical protein
MLILGYASYCLHPLRKHLGPHFAYRYFPEDTLVRGQASGGLGFDSLQVKHFPVLHSIQPGSETDPVTCKMGTAKFSTVDKAEGA